MDDLESVADIRSTLQPQVQKLDPAGTNAMLRQMVIIGHSGQGQWRLPEGLRDRVLPSAQVDYAESVFTARSGHSCLDDSATIEEVRRILHEHLKQTIESPTVISE